RGRLLLRDRADHAPDPRRGSPRRPGRPLPHRARRQPARTAARPRRAPEAAQRTSASGPDAEEGLVTVMDDVDTIRREGYLVIEDLLDERELSALRRELSV